MALYRAPTPSASLANDIDQLLEQDPCVRSVDRWPSRFYVWEKPAWAKSQGTHLIWVLSGPWLGSDTSKVSVRFHEIAVPGVYPPGRSLLRADQDVLALDSSNNMLVLATYDVRTEKLTSLYCGPN